MPNQKIEVLARAIIEVKGEILLCQKLVPVETGKGAQYYFLPGGHVEFGESAKQALKRELKEELGLKIKECSFIGGSEHLFLEDGKKRHEVNLVFQAKTDKLKTESREDHIQFFLLNKKQFVRQTILPKVLKAAVLKWFEDKKRFWVCQM